MPLSLEEIRRLEEEEGKSKNAFGGFGDTTKEGGVNTNAPLKQRKFSKDELKGQRQRKRFVQARKAGEDTTDKRPSFMGNPSDKGKKFYKTGFDGRELTRISKEDNPFKVKNLRDFDYSAYGRGSQRDRDILNVNDVRGLNKQGGFDYDKIEKRATKDGVQISKHAKNFLDKKLGRVKKDKSDPIISDTPDNNTMPVKDPGKFKDSFKDKVINDMRAGDIGTASSDVDTNNRNDFKNVMLSDGSSINIDQSTDTMTLGGDTRIFYGGGSTGGRTGEKDFFNSDYSDAVMAGFDDVSDSPAAAGRDYMLATMFNKNYQDKLRKEREFNKPNYAGQVASSNMFDEEEMMNQLIQKKQNSLDLATIKQAELFGDPGLEMPVSSYSLPRKREMPELTFM